MWHIILALIVVLTSVGISALPAMPVLAAGGTWSSGPSMSTTRGAHAGALLQDGRVLVSGGWNGSYLDSTEIYTPGPNPWSTVGNMLALRQNHVMVALLNGKALVAGGNNPGNLASAEIFDPVSGTWSDAGSMSVARIHHSAALLTSGKVIVTGGASTGVFASTDLYDPALDSWSAGGTMTAARSAHTTTALSDGKVLVAGGGGLDYNTLLSAEIYDPGSNSWTATPNMINRHSWHSATLLADGRVLVAGGQVYTSSPYVNTIVNTAEIYDPAADSWSLVANMNGTRSGQTATLLPDGTVLVTGGGNSGGILDTTEIYDPVANTWSSAGTMSTTRCNHTATKLQNNKVLIAAGHQYHSEAGALATTEFFSPCLNISASAGDNGTINPSGTIAVNYGDNQTFTINPDPGYHIDTLMVDSTAVTPVTSYTFTNVTANHTIAASFAITNQPPVALFTHSPEAPNVNQKVTFNASTSDDPDGTIVAYSWNFGDGGTATGVTVEHTYSNANDYGVILTVTDNGGATDQSGATITVTQPAAPAPQGRRSLPDPNTFAMVGSGLIAALLYISLSRLRRRLNRG